MKAVFGFLLVTIPSIIYSASNWVFTIILMPFAFIHQLVRGRTNLRAGRQRAAISHVFLKYGSPLFLMFGVPFILFKLGWFMIAWVFGAWMIIYFVIRRLQGTDRRDEEYYQALRYSSLSEKEKEKESDARVQKVLAERAKNK